MRQAFANLDAVARAAGGSLAHAVKFSLFLTDLSKFATVNQIMGEAGAEAVSGALHRRRREPAQGRQFEVEAVLVL